MDASCMPIDLYNKGRYGKKNTPLPYCINIHSCASDVEADTHEFPAHLGHHHALVMLSQ